MLQPGDRIGRYEIQRRLGRGGMGSVYVAHDPILGRMVALKMLAGDLDAADAAEKFAREARAAAALNHTHIVTVHDFGEFSSQPFIVMEYVQGDTLARLIRTKAQLSLAERLRLMQELCSGVAYAHRLDVIHRDIKPANLMVDRTGRLKILDFGIAKMVGSSLSKGTALIGTPGYMAPEQIRGEAIDRRSDLFSIGVVGYELLSYAEAFPGDSVPAITHRILNEEPVSLRRLVPDIPEPLVGIIEKALKKSPADRFADAESFGAAIADVGRQVAGDARWETSPPTLVAVRGGANRGSGPGSDAERPPSRDFSDTPATTPSAEPIGVGREEILRRRTRQIDASLTRARTLLETGDLEEALEACVQALTLDDTHAGALEVERTVRTAMARYRASALLREARVELGRGALTVAHGLLIQARTLDPDAADARSLDRDLRLARAEQEDARQCADAVKRALDVARATLEQGQTDSALAAARQARRLDPTSDAARQLEAEILRRLDMELGEEPPRPVGTPTVISSPPAAAAHQAGPSDAEAARTVVAKPRRRTTEPASTPAAAVAPPPPRAVPPASPPPVLQALNRMRAGIEGHVSRAGRQVRTLASVTVPRLFSQARAKAVSGAAHVGQLVRARPGAASSTKPQGPKTTAPIRPARILWTLGATLVLVAIAVSAFLFFRPSLVVPVRVGTLMIDAAPWAVVTAIVSEDGTSQPLPDSASTPMSLSLPAGTYRVTLTGPPPESASREVRVTVEDGTTPASVQAQFTPLTVDAYFEPYLASKPDVAEPDAPGAASSPAPDGLPSEVRPSA